MYERLPTFVTSNLDFDERDHAFATNRLLASVAVDRTRSVRSPRGSVDLRSAPRADGHRRTAVTIAETTGHIGGNTQLRDQYDDGGYSGGSTERPALQRLLDDVRSSLVDVIVVYKIDRLSWSLADFAGLRSGGFQRWPGRGADASRNARSTELMRVW